MASGDHSGSAGSDPSKYRAIDIDWHRTLSEAGHSPNLGQPNPGMVEGIKAVLDRYPDSKVWVSCGGIGDYGEKLKAAFRVWLRQHGVDISRVDFRDKPRTVAVIDDHAIQYDGSNATALWSEVFKRLDRLDESGPDVPMKGGVDAGHSSR